MYFFKIKMLNRPIFLLQVKLFQYKHQWFADGKKTKSLESNIKPTSKTTIIENINK